MWEISAVRKLRHKPKLSSNIIYKVLELERAQNKAHRISKIIQVKEKKKTNCVAKKLLLK